ncbi:FAD-binding protein [bacterium]|nr:FAD-binding protein [bacterium]
MEYTQVQIEGLNIDVYSLNTAVVGSGAAGLNAVDRLYSFGQRDIALITEGLMKGTSRNTGSDKQTYYKLTVAGESPDSVYEMAETLFQGGCMHGDIALVESALSARCFFRLVELGVPFPHNTYGEYVGYKTDHDPRQRATSIGPLTSKYMTERLQEEVQRKGIKIFDGYQVIGILTDRAKTKSIGLLALNLNELENPDKRYVLFNCTNIIYATGGPAGMYKSSVYPESQTGSTGIALEAGVKARNVTESQFGIASIKFRWNLSGTYQQVLPRYVSTDKDGNDEREFLLDYFKDPRKMLTAIFLKGYQWPFDPRKVKNYGSSLIDILVYYETVIKGRRVFLDFTRNPLGDRFSFDLLEKEAYDYLARSKVLFGTPIERLAHMNQPAIDLYKDHGIDITKEYLEIAVCNQHNNGGLVGDIWWESNIKHFFPVGEVNGSHGVYRPGGSALNSGQVGSTRSAEYISACYREAPMPVEEFVAIAKEQIIAKIELGRRFLSKMGEVSNVSDIRKKIGERMDRDGGIIRSLESAYRSKEEAKADLKSITEITRISSIKELPYAYQNYDLLITQYVYLSAIANYIEKGGRSRGSYLVYDSNGELPLPELPEVFRFSLDEGRFSKTIQEVLYSEGECHFDWVPVRPIPKGDDWFENVWNDFRKGIIYKKE